MKSASPETPPFPLPAFQAALLGWYAAHRRELPWREEPSPYKTVVSEFMLQQTQVKTVLPYFHRWLRELPDFAALAAAPEDRILKLWEGLGYYSRARNLHKLARAVAELPKLPRNPEAWLDLPGVGPYTAAAITSISFGVPVACVDGNVVRILARLTANPTAFRDSAGAAKVFAPLAAALVPAVNPGDHNQAMMELGATICHRHDPLCTVCPVLKFCAAARKGDPEAYPRLAAKKIERLSETRLWCEHHGALLLHRIHRSARRLASLHELPRAADLGLDDQCFNGQHPLAVRRRSITRYAITESIYQATAQKLIETANKDLVWAPLDQLDSLTLSGPHRRWIREILRDRAFPAA